MSLADRITTAWITPVLAALCILFLPLRWLFAFTIAAMVHELGHYAVVTLLGGEIRYIDVGVHGANMEISQMDPVKELAAAFSGPAASILLLFLFRWTPRVSLCALAQAVWNLLPIYPLDGGRILRCTAAIFSGTEDTERVCRPIEKWCMILLGALSMYSAVFLKMGLLPLLLYASLCRKKYLAKRDFRQYNKSGLCSNAQNPSYAKRYGYDRYKAADSAHRAKTRPLHRR